MVGTISELLQRSDSISSKNKPGSNDCIKTKVPLRLNVPISLTMPPPIWKSGIALIQTPPFGKFARVAIRCAALMTPRW